MALIEAAVRGRLAGYSDLVALVSTRIMPMTLPGNPTYPTITFQRVGGTQELSMGIDAGVSEARMQFDCWSNNYLDAKNVSAQVKKALLNYTDNQIYFTQLENEIDFYEVEVKLFRTSLEFIIQYQEVD